MAEIRLHVKRPACTTTMSPLMSVLLEGKLSPTSNAHKKENANHKEKNAKHKKIEKGRGSSHPL